MRVNIPNNPDESLLVRFRLEAVLDDAATQAAGGEVKWKNVEYLEIHIPGDRTQVYEGPVTETHRTRFASRYERWKRGQQDVPDGTPLALMGAAITPAEVKMLAEANIHTVEALANVSDGNISKVGRAVALRDKARRYLETMRTTAPLEALESKLRDEQSKVLALAEKVERLSAALDARAAEPGESAATLPPGASAEPPRRAPARLSKA